MLERRVRLKTFASIVSNAQRTLTEVAETTPAAPVTSLRPASRASCRPWSKPGRMSRPTRRRRSRPTRPPSHRCRPCRPCSQPRPQRPRSKAPDAAAYPAPSRPRAVAEACGETRPDAPKVTLSMPNMPKVLDEHHRGRARRPRSPPPRWPRPTGTLVKPRGPRRPPRHPAPRLDPADRHRDAEALRGTQGHDPELARRGPGHAPGDLDQACGSPQSRRTGARRSSPWSATRLAPRAAA